MWKCGLDRGHLSFLAFAVDSLVGDSLIYSCVDHFRQQYELKRKSNLPYFANSILEIRHLSLEFRFCPTFNEICLGKTGLLNFLKRQVLPRLIGKLLLKLQEAGYGKPVS
ncbi:hypothetical protein QQ045_003837 [Rhodiola kirilowii]